MITLLIICFALGIGIRLVGFALQLSWGILKIVFGVVLFPVLIIGLIIIGFSYLAIPLLVVLGIVGLVKLIKRGSAA